MTHVQKTHVAWYLGRAQNLERQLAESLQYVSDKHERDPEIQAGTRLLARWSWDHVERLKSQIARYGEHTTPDPENLRAALFHGNRFGGFGLVRDLSDLLVLVNAARATWTIVNQAANALKDTELETFSSDCCNDTTRQLAWLQGELRHLAPQAISVRAEPGPEIAQSVPRRATTAGIPDALWAPVAGAAVLLVVGFAGVMSGLLQGAAAGLPWLFPALGPTAYLQAENPAHPASRFYNTVVGHLIGLLAGFAAVALVGAWDAPVVLQAKVLVPERVWAAAIALALTLATASLVRASHPPAGATTLLVALGSFRTLQDAGVAMAGVLIAAIVGEGIRRARLLKPFGGERYAADLAEDAPGSRVPAGGRA